MDTSQGMYDWLGRQGRRGDGRSFCGCAEPSGVAETELEFCRLGLGGKGDCLFNGLTCSLGKWRLLEGLT